MIQNDPEDSRKVQNVPKGSRLFQNVPEDYGMSQKAPEKVGQTVMIKKQLPMGNRMAFEREELLALLLLTLRLLDMMFGGTPEADGEYF